MTMVTLMNYMNFYGRVEEPFFKFGLTLFISVESADFRRKTVRQFGREIESAIPPGAVGWRWHLEK